jgi:TP901 family phage tail tape measure protein
VAYTAANVLVGSLQTLLDVGAQVARLDQVFSGVGGSAQQLANDVLGTAAALGRERTEALESAIAWSRLGLTRQQVNEAVRVSLTAANVAEIDALSATENLLAIMAAYKLEVRELSGVLDLLNETSNNFNVTNKDLLEGIQRTGAVAQQAGLSLAGLVGLLGVGVGTTGQSGSNIGNALKALTLNLANPDRQEYLRRSLGIEVLADDQGALKPLPDLLDEIAIAYEKVNDQERGVLIERLAGKFQASRITALLEGYAKANVLAANSLTGFNSAAEENARITSTLKNALSGFKTTGQRAVVGAFGGLAEDAGQFTDNLRLLADAGVGKLQAFSRFDPRRLAFAVPNFLAGQAVGLLGLRDPNEDLGKREAMLRAEAEGYETAARGVRQQIKRFDEGLPIERAIGGLRARFLPKSLPEDDRAARDYLESLLPGLDAKAESLGLEAWEARQELIQGATDKLKEYIAEREKLREEVARKGETPARATKEEQLSRNIAQAEQNLEKLKTIKEPITYDAEGNVVSGSSVLNAKAFTGVVRDLTSAFQGLAATPLGRFNTELAFLERVSKNLWDTAKDNTAFGDLARDVGERVEILRRQRPLAEFQNRLDLGGRIAGARADSFLIGDTEGERLLEQRKRLAESQQSLRERGLRTEAEQIQFLFQAKQLDENRLRLLERQFSVARELEELKRNARREEARALANAGPDEILRRLAARQLGGVDNANQFLSLSPDMRGLLAADPDSPFNGDANRLREDQRRTGAFNFFSQYGGIGGLPSLGGGGDPMLEGILQSFAENLPTEALARMSAATEANATAQLEAAGAAKELTTSLRAAAAAAGGGDLLDTGKQAGLPAKPDYTKRMGGPVGLWGLVSGLGGAR